MTFVLFKPPRTALGKLESSASVAPRCPSTWWKCVCLLYACSLNLDPVPGPTPATENSRD